MFTKNMNLNVILNTRIPVYDGIPSDSYGIEVELEGSNIFPPSEAVKSRWSCHDDGSLRKLKPNDQAVEYVLKKPVSIDSTVSAIQILFNFLKSPEKEVYDSYRTSIHVHLNFGEETLRTIYNFMTLAIIFDELFVSQNGDHRIGNNFCLRSMDAKGQIVSLKNSIENGHEFFDLQADHRYSSINFVSLLKFGSIEFRSLECTLHEGRLLHWISTLTELKKASKEFSSPTEIVQRFSIMSPKAFLNSILGPCAYKYSFVPGYDTMLHNGMRIAQDFAFCSAWNCKNKPS